MESWEVQHDWVTEQQKKDNNLNKVCLCRILYDPILSLMIRNITFLLYNMGVFHMGISSPILKKNKEITVFFFYSVYQVPLSQNY